VSIFLSPMDVHINRSPIAGKIVDVIYKPGAFKIATKKIASEVNEQNVITIENAEMRVVTRRLPAFLPAASCAGNGLVTSYPPASGSA
jgi:phosphatidylserine decarboxylase